MPAIKRRWTAADVRAITHEDRTWPRYELIDGELLVTPAPRMLHQLTVSEIWSLLDGYVLRGGMGLAMMSPSDLELKTETITQPDVFVIPIETKMAGDILQWPDVKSLLLAVEVISPSSIRTDRITKRDFYLDAGVEEYWIVDLDASIVERWRPMQETPDVLRDQLAWHPRDGDPLVIELIALFDRIRKKAGMFARS